jgi:hypothetical protein
MRRKDPADNQNQLGNLLDRYKHIFKPPQATVEKEAIVVIFEIVHLTVTESQVKYSVGTQTLAITAPSLIRSEIKQHQNAVLLELQKRLGVKNAPKTII